MSSFVHGPGPGVDSSEPSPPREDWSSLLPVPRPSVWQQVWMRVLLAVLALLLTLILLLQLGVQERDRLAAQLPSWRPALEGLCLPLGCRVAPLRQIESIAVEHTSLSRLAPGIYQFGFTLRNSAWVELALPALELTLHDAREQVLLRRVLRPGELQLDTDVLPANSEVHGRLTLSIGTPDDASRLSGYRLLAFYL